MRVAQATFCQRVLSEGARVSRSSARRAWITVTARRGAGCREERTAIFS